MKRLINIFFSAVFLLTTLSSFAQATSKTPAQLPGRSGSVVDTDSTFIFNSGQAASVTMQKIWQTYIKLKTDALYAAIGSGGGPTRTPGVVIAEYNGLVGDGVTNNQVRLKAIIDSLQAIGDHEQGGDIVFGPGTFIFYNTTAATDWYLNARIIIAHSHIHLIGKGAGVTIFKFLSTGGTDPQTHYDVYNSPEFGNVAVRCPGILIHAVSNTYTIRDTRIERITLDGGMSQMSYDNTYPAEPNGTQNNRWDLSHKAIMIYGDSGTNTDDTYVLYCEIRDWLGEEFWAGLATKKVFIQNNHFTKCNASAISLGGSLTIVDNEIDSCTNGIECYTGPGRSFVARNRVHDCWELNGKANGIVWGGATSIVYDDMEAIIDNNEVWNCQVAGITLLRENRELTVSNNRVHDCYHLIRLEPFDSPMEGIHIFGNTLSSKYWIVNAAFAYLGAAPSISVDNVDIHNNYIYETDTARNANIGISYGFLHYQTKGNRFAFHDNVIDIKGYGQADATGGSGTVTFPVVYRNEYVRGVLLKDGHYTLGSTLTILPMEAQGLFNYDDGAGNVNIDFDTRGADGTEATVYKNDALTHYVFQLSNSHFKLKADFALTAQNDWVRFKKRNGKWEVIGTNTQF